jgi:hypothetical protein
VRVLATGAESRLVRRQNKVAASTYTKNDTSYLKGMDHRHVIVRVNAPVDEGIAPLVVALSEISGLVTMESCQGHDGQQDAFVVFHMGDWRTCGKSLFDQLLTSMSHDLRSDVSLRLEAYDTQFARGWITLNPAAIESLSECVKRLASSPEC